RRREPRLLRPGRRGEERADRRERLRVGRRVPARRAADRRLVDEDDLARSLEARDLRRAHSPPEPPSPPTPPSTASPARRRYAFHTTSESSVLLPDPDTPVTAQRTPAGRS